MTRKTKLLDPLGASSTGGQLFVVGTPVGNLGDITLRALRTLKDVDLIACEDTRRTRKLLTHYKIEIPTVSYHQHNEITRAPELIIQMEQGSKIALVTDAGMPAISDPGWRLVHLAIRHKIPIVPIPGPVAFAAALATAGLAVDQFGFMGFLPSKRPQRRKAIEGLKNMTPTLVFYEAPHRLVEMLEDIQEILGDRQVAVAREMTKIHEEFFRGRVPEVLDRLRKKPVKGEITIVVSGFSKGEPGPKPRPSVRKELEQVMQERGLDERGALKVVARSRGISRSEAYRQLQADRTVASDQ